MLTETLDLKNSLFKQLQVKKKKKVLFKQFPTRSEIFKKSSTA